MASAISNGYGDLGGSKCVASTTKNGDGEHG
jgi:hypothetical protein